MSAEDNEVISKAFEHTGAPSVVALTFNHVRNLINYRFFLYWFVKQVQSKIAATALAAIINEQALVQQRFCYAPKTTSGAASL